MLFAPTVPFDLQFLTSSVTAGTQTFTGLLFFSCVHVKCVFGGGTGVYLDVNAHPCVYIYVEAQS